MSRRARSSTATPSRCSITTAISPAAAATRWASITQDTRFLSRLKLTARAAQSAAAELDRAHQQRGARCRSHQSRHPAGRDAGAGQGHRAPRAHEVPVERRLLRDCWCCATSARNAAVARWRSTSMRTSRTCSKCADSSGARAAAVSADGARRRRRALRLCLAGRRRRVRRNWCSIRRPTSCCRAGPSSSSNCRRGSVAPSR